MIESKNGLLTKLCKTEIDEREYITSPLKNGGVTVLCKKNGRELYISSKYDPMKAGEQFAKGIYRKNAVLAVYGLGLGYHIKALAGMLEEEQTLYVFEANLVTTKIAIEQTDIMETLEKPNVVFYCAEDSVYLARGIDAALSKTGGELSIYPPSLKIIPKCAAKLRDILEEYDAFSKSLAVQSGTMAPNHEFNTSAGYINGVKLLSGAFSKMPAIVVAAGASLDLNAGDLKKCADKALIISVTRAAKKLLSEGIKPDFYIATDANAWLPRHLDFDNVEMDSPLLLLSTADRNASAYRGKKLVVYEKSSAPSENEDFYIEAGGSVATAALSMCVRLGADPVVMVGQDLCYCFEKTHAGPDARKVIPLAGGKYVCANDGNKYYTSGSLHIYLKWMERFIAKNPQTSFYNATALGAVIGGAPNIELLNFFNDYTDIRNEINAIKKDFGLC